MPDNENRLDEFHFAFEGADHPDGPWHHLRVLELRGVEAISRLFWFELEVMHDNRGADVDVMDLVGSRAALKIFTRTDPSHRIIHAVISEAEQLELASGADMSRYRIRLGPPMLRHAIMRRSRIFIEKTLRQIIEQVLQATSMGLAMTPSTASRPQDVSSSLESYEPASMTFAWAIEDIDRLDDVTARSYCVQYDESDHDFISRLCEEEGISYHFDHGDRECVLVFTDFDGGRIDRTRGPAFGPNIKGREVFDWRAGGRLRPRSVHMDDYNWRKPTLDLRAISESGATEFTDIVHPGRYEETSGHGDKLATVREERYDTERDYAAASGHARLLTAGVVFVLEHSVDKFSGTYLVTEVHHHGTQRHFGTQGSKVDEPYRQKLEMIRCGRGDEVEDSFFRPARRTPKPRIYGTQTAVVTADPTDTEAEINVGGPADIGCVRVRFRWDIDSGRHAIEPTSCWVRVNQFFAGSDHGALWHPRVGNEVIVEFLDGDPDRPIVTGRVYNGVNPAPENATNRPTYSAIKSNTSPYNGNYNLIAFEDLQGSEEIIIHAARDWNSNVERNCTRGVGLHETIHVKGNQSITVDLNQTVQIGIDQSIVVGANIHCVAGTSIKNESVSITNNADVDFNVNAGVIFNLVAGAVGIVKAPITRVDATILFLVGQALVKMFGAHVDINGSQIDIKGGTINVAADGTLLLTGGPIKIIGGNIEISGGNVIVDGSPVSIKGGSLVDIDGDSIHLN